MSPDLDRLNLLLSLGRYAEGEKAAREAIGENPEWGAGYGFLALFLSNQGHHLPAIRAAKDCVGKDPHDPWSHAVRASVLNRLGRSDQALVAADEAIRLDPTYAFAYRVRCEILCAEQRPRDARATAIDGLKYHPTDEMLLHWKGWAEYRTDRLDTAVRTAEDGLKHHPDSSSLRNVLGCARMDLADSGWPVVRLRNYRAADAAFREAIRLRPGEPVYQDNRRNNALRCRRFVLKPLMAAVMVNSFVVMLFGTMVAVRAVRPHPGLFLLCAAAYVPWLVLLVQARDWFLLSAPLGWLGIPTVPLPPDEARKGRRWWRVVIAAWIAAPVVAWTAALAVRL